MKGKGEVAFGEVTGSVSGVEREERGCGTIIE